MSLPRPLYSSSSPSPKGRYTDDVQIFSACQRLRLVLDQLFTHIQDNLNLREVNARLNGETVSAPPDYSNANGRKATGTEAIELLSEINDVTNHDGYEKRLTKGELLEKLKNSFEKVDRLAAELIAENEDLKESNDSWGPNGAEQFKQAREQLKNRKEEGEEQYQEGSFDDDTCSSPEEESAETYTDLCSLQVRASDKLVCLLEDLDSQIQENQKLRKVNAKLKGDPSPPPPYDKNTEAEAAAEEARQLLLELKSRVYRNDEQQDLNKLVQKLKKKSKEIGSLTAKVIRESKDLKETNDLLKIYGVPKFERQSDIKEVVTAPTSAPRDQDRIDDDLREKNRFLQAKLQAQEAAMRDARKTTGATTTPVLSSLGDVTTSKELENVRAELVEANVRISQLMKAATASSQQHLPCPLEPELKDARKELVAANVRIGELEKQVAEAGSSAELVAANERIVELKKLLAGAIAKATHSSPGPKPEENVGSSSPTSGPAARLPLVSKATVDPEATDIPPPLDTLSPAERFIRRAELPSDSQQVKQQVKSIDSFKPLKHPSSVPSSSPPNDPPPSSAAEPLHFLRSASAWLRWLIWFLVLSMMLVGVFLCWIEWAGLHRERSMWLGANEISRMEVEGEIAKALRGWDRVGIVFCLDRGLSLEDSSLFLDM